MFNILVVEDDADLNRSVCKYLNQHGYNATGCLNADAAYDAIYGTVFDLIVSDIMLPGTDGYELTETVRSLNSEIPILFMTARDDFASKQKGCRAGLIAGASMAVNVGSLILAVQGKMVMSFGWASLYTFLNVLFRKKFGVAIASSFLLGTGAPVIGAAAALGDSPVLNLLLYGSSVNACLGSNPVTLITCLAVSVLWAVIWNVLGSAVLANCDVY